MQAQKDAEQRGVTFFCLAGFFFFGRGIIFDIELDSLNSL
jgi:hypothetical protein